MQNIIKNKRKWIVLGSIFSYLILFILLSFMVVARNHLPIYFPNEEKREMVNLSELQQDSFLYLRVNPKERDNLQVEVYTEDGKKIPLGGVTVNKKEPFYDKTLSNDPSGPKEGYYYYYGKIDENKIEIITKNKTNHIVFSRILMWYIYGDGWSLY
ncbi:hypothetical protein RsY01_1945 [Lactococcus reticulitermitis]|uniref:Uncharacterized protein n=2 Tax=Pseudolactococcus reticulitermitis TaxID=2025039 RepID=A0A224X2F1_9LACT|nr:hypothetical protein RsY01_1945 [Lactococcus reticulitermitis]